MASKCIGDLNIVDITRQLSLSGIETGFQGR